MPCERQSTKKYISRGSPSFPANECHGETMMGNDGRMYASVSNKNGIYRWLAVKSATKISSPRKRTSPRKSSPMRKSSPPTKVSSPRKSASPRKSSPMRKSSPSTKVYTSRKGVKGQTLWYYKGKRIAAIKVPARYK